ncbi:phosphodiester glycosidase family protein [Sphingobacterium pedocola]|uniref:Phosphodiester glycosidase domain-containing protein n=1 Tax=Sphingobacterium pedocola TaxID=2082722 RepID=A0ABR9T793_9SPHI|nr:phosphodiester glycosidase family protein [Sphingobacterium pedocola]MBE8721231.1 hypothetical protein [Sphingobacterium pedocola]
MVTLIRKGLLLFIVALSFVTCGKEQIQEEVETLLPEYAKGATIKTGQNQVKLSFMIAEGISACEVFWNKRQESIKIDIGTDRNKTIEQVIEDLPEGNYTFEIITTDERNLTSGLVLSTRVYGEKYIETLSNRTVRELGFFYNEEPYIDWAASSTTEVGIDLFYTTVDNEERKIRIDKADRKSVLPDYKSNTAIRYLTRYLPEKASLDTFSSSTVVIPPPTYYASSVGRIISGSGMVSHVYSHSFTALSESVSYASVRFENRSKQPLSIYILRADLKDPKVKISALMPNNRTNFGLQTVRAMIEARHNSGETILAGTNADFFDWEPVSGVPWGPIFVNGNVIKNTAKNPGITYFAIKKDGTPSIGGFSSLPVANHADMQDLVGGGVRLIAQGKMLPFQDVEKHPRTVVGYTKDRVVYILVIDGRQSSHSVGMTYSELAQIMFSIGVEEAINLDGGGSSTMVVKNNNAFGIVNKHSDASPRAVANGLGISLKN